MNAQKETVPGITAAAAQNALSQLTVLRPLLTQAPFCALQALLGAIAREDGQGCTEAYHALTGALLDSDARRVTGDIWRDYLMHSLLLTPNRFSRLAAQGVRDEALCVAMRYDLWHLGTLCALSSAVIKDWLAKPAQRPDPHTPQDNISRLSSAAWTGSVPVGGGAAPAPAPMKAPSLPAQNWLGWRYGMPESLPDHYLADEALEEIYHRLQTVSDWGTLLDDIWNFHAGYGTGAFLRHRLFAVTAAGLSPLRDEDLPEEEKVVLYRTQQETLLRTVIRFMRQEPAQDLLLCGGDGTGRTTQVLCVARELPEVRLILLDMTQLDRAMELLPTLAAQPLRFLLFVDDADLTHPAWRRFTAAVRTAKLQGGTFLLLAAAKEGRDSMLPLRVQFAEPDMKTFIRLVDDLAKEAGLSPAFSDIENACIDCKAAGEPLNYHTAYAIVDQLQA